MKQGQILVLTSGAYDEYGVDLVVRVLRDFSPTNVIDIWKATRSRGQSNDLAVFRAWLVEQGYLEVLEHQTWHEWNAA